MESIEGNYRKILIVTLIASLIASFSFSPVASAQSNNSSNDLEQLSAEQLEQELKFLFEEASYKEGSLTKVDESVLEEEYDYDFSDEEVKNIEEFVQASLGEVELSTDSGNTGGFSTQSITDDNRDYYKCLAAAIPGASLSSFAGGSVQEALSNRNYGNAAKRLAKAGAKATPAGLIVTLGAAVPTCAVRAY